MCDQPINECDANVIKHFMKTIVNELFTNPIYKKIKKEYQIRKIQSNYTIVDYNVTDDNDFLFFRFLGRFFWLPLQ